MSRGLRERRLEAEERWPNLVKFLRRDPHQGRPAEGATPEDLIDKAVAQTELAERQLILSQWSDWNNAAGWKSDVIRSLNDAIGVGVSFASDGHARQFMNMVHDKLIVSVRRELGTKWQPS